MQCILIQVGLGGKSNVPAAGHESDQDGAWETVRCGMQVNQPPELKDAVGPKRLASKVTTILQRIEKELDTVDMRIGDAMHILDADNDGLVSP